MSGAIHLDENYVIFGGIKLGVRGRAPLRDQMAKSEV